VSEVEKLWLDEAERRLDDYRAGKIQGIPGKEVFERAMSSPSLIIKGVQRTGETV
jgi:hypothetical protein